MSRISVLGLGYVGSVTATCLARDGHGVIGIDINGAKADAINAGVPPLEEPGLADLLRASVASGRLRATTNVAEAVRSSEAAIICVGTPTGPDETPDLRSVEHSCAQIGLALRKRTTPFTVIVRSTVPPGTAEELVARTLADSSKRTVGAGPRDIQVLSVPEFLREASAIADYDDPPFFVVGAPTPTPEQARRVVTQLFGTFAARTHWVPYRTAELLKNVCNAYHALKVVFANEVGALCQAADIDGIEMMRVFCEDRKLNVSPAYLRPGLPFGGSCLPKDLRALLYLGRRYGIDLPQLAGTLESNERHIERTLDYIEALGKQQIALEGLSFKPGTDDVRESPMLAIAERLLGRGYDLRIYDPLVARAFAQKGPGRLAHLARLFVATPEALVRHAEVLIKGRSSDELVRLAKRLRLQPVVIDLGRPPYRVPAPAPIVAPKARPRRDLPELAA